VVRWVSLKDSTVMISAELSEHMLGLDGLMGPSKEIDLLNNLQSNKLLTMIKKQ